MIQKGTFLKVIDNSGAKNVCCIRIVSNQKYRYAYTGDILLVSVKKLRAKRRFASKVKKGQLLHALVVRTKQKNSYFFYAIFFLLYLSLLPFLSTSVALSISLSLFLVLKLYLSLFLFLFFLSFS